MTSGVGVISVWADAASASKPFTWTEAIVIFVVVIVGVGLALAYVGRSRLLISRSRRRSPGSVRIERAAMEDVEAIERDAELHGRPVQGIPRREEDNDDL